MLSVETDGNMARPEQSPVVVIVGSKNKVKVEAVRQAFADSFPGVAVDFRGVSVESGVPHQPWGIQETLQGATTRADNAERMAPEGDYFVGLEGGVEDCGKDLMSFAWMVVKQRSTGLYGKAQTAHFVLPAEVARLVRSGMELGHADDQVFQRTNSKESSGACGLLTGDLIDRTVLYKHALLLALVPFRPENASLYGADPFGA